MTSRDTGFGKILLWGGLTALLYWILFNHAELFLHLAHTTVDACAVQENLATNYYYQATPQLCAERGGTYTDGTWWYVFAPIALALALSYTHGIFTGLFWDVLGLKAKK